MATPHHALGHACEQSAPGLPARTRTSAWLRPGLLLGATATLTVTLLSGTALADPRRASSPEQAAQFVADASHRLEVVSEHVNQAREELQQQQAAADAADRAADAAQQQLDALDEQIRRIARSAYTRGDDHFTQLDVMLTSDSADEFVSQLGTLDAIAGHTNAVVTEVSAAADAAERARAAADRAAETAQRTLDGIEAKQADLEAQIADYQRQYNALTAAQQAQVSRVHAGNSVAAPPSGSVIAPSAAAQAAVNTALAQVGDPYVWGASGPDSFDCSGLTQYAYAAAGVTLPHSSSMQSRMGAPVSRSQLQPGDLVFFYSPVSHVGIYIGNGQMVHAATSGQPVKVVSIDSMPGFNSARRLAG